MRMRLSFRHVLSLVVLLCLATTSQAFFDPTVGRWASRDPINENGGLNLRGFVRNDPVGSTDTFGLLVGTVSINPSSPVVVDPSYPGTIFYRRGWLIGITWKPPGSWSGWSCNCLPCHKVVWVQDVAYGKGNPFEEDWGVANAARYGYAWDCAKSGSGGAAMFDQPDQHNFSLRSFVSPYSFYAKSVAKCIAGRDSGKTYATVLWGFTWTRDSTPVGLGPIIY